MQKTILSVAKSVTTLAKDRHLNKLVNSKQSVNDDLCLVNKLVSCLICRSSFKLPYIFYTVLMYFVVCI